jgi:hypothetical protein
LVGGKNDVVPGAYSVDVSCHSHDLVFQVMPRRSLGAHGRYPFDIEFAEIGSSLTWKEGREHEHVQVRELTSEVPAQQQSLVLRCC